MTHTVSRPVLIAATRRVRLRTKALSDAPNDYRWRRDPEIARFDAARPMTLAYSRFLHQFERDLAVVDPTRLLVAVDTHDGEHIGNVMYYNADTRRRTAEFGICIGSAHHRDRGFGTDATIAFMGYLFGECGFAVIHLHTLEWNERARRSFARSGFHEVARVTRGGQEFVRMEARRDAWLRRWPVGDGDSSSGNVLVTKKTGG